MNVGEPLFLLHVGKFEWKRSRRGGGRQRIRTGRTNEGDRGVARRDVHSDADPWRQRGLAKGRTMERLIELIKDLIARKFYGELVLKFEAGVIVQCKKTESIKLEKMEP